MPPDQIRPDAPNTRNRKFTSGITEGQDDRTRNEQGKMGVIYMIAILGTFLLAGTLIISFFGISLPGVRIAGGILIGRVAFMR